MLNKQMSHCLLNDQDAYQVESIKIIVFSFGRRLSVISTRSNGFYAQHKNFAKDIWCTIVHVFYVMNPSTHLGVKELEHCQLGVIVL